MHKPGVLLLKFKPPLQRAILRRRYKRFLADVELDNGKTVTVHCPNTGSMLNCLIPDSPCWLSTANNPKRKYAYTWEIATTPGRKKAGINTGRANALVKEAIENDVIEELQGYPEVLTEVPYGKEKSRIDFLLTGHSRRRESNCYVEVKNVTLAELNGRGLFPDAVSARGSKHLRELMHIKSSGHRAVLFFCVQHTGINWVEPAHHIDPVYAQTLKQALQAGVEVIAYKTKISAQEIILTQKIPFKFGN